MDVFAGARLWLTDIDISLSLPVGAGSGSERDRWWDPFVGARLWTPIAGPVGLSLRADVGGFGIGEASDVAWQAWALVTWRMSRHWSLGVGYRVSYYDRITGSGPDKNGMDLFQYGPMVGIGFST